MRDQGKKKTGPVLAYGDPGSTIPVPSAAQPHILPAFWPPGYRCRATGGPVLYHPGAGLRPEPQASLIPEAVGLPGLHPGQSWKERARLIGAVCRTAGLTLRMSSRGHKQKGVLRDTEREAGSTESEDPGQETRVSSPPLPLTSQSAGQSHGSREPGLIPPDGRLEPRSQPVSPRGSAPGGRR